MLSQHYAGVAFDTAQTINEQSRNYMRNLAIASGYWRYVEPAYLTPRWVHFDDRWIASGYPLTQTRKQRNIRTNSTRRTKHTRL